MSMLYRFHREIDVLKTANINLLMLDQLEALLQDMVEIKVTDIQPASVTFLYQASPSGVKYYKRENLEEAVFLDLMSDTFDMICKYSNAFPIEQTFKSYEHLKSEMQRFSTWVLENLDKETYHKLTKEEFNKTRRTKW